jgi:hypothetical protein
MSFQHSATPGHRSFRSCITADMSRAKQFDVSKVNILIVAKQADEVILTMGLVVN